MYVVIVSYPHGDEGLIGNEVSLGEGTEIGRVIIKAPNGMTHDIALKNVSDIVSISNTHNLKK